MWLHCYYSASYLIALFCPGEVAGPPNADCYATAPSLLCGWSDGLELELCADVIVSAAARRSHLVGGGGGAARRGRPKIVFSKIHEKISFYPQNFLRNFFSHHIFEVADDQCKQAVCPTCKE